MNEYEVKFSVNDKTYTETKRAGTSEDARRLVKSQNPNAVIKDVKKIS